MTNPDDKHYLPCPTCEGRGVETSFVRPAHLPYEVEVRQVDVPCACCGGTGIVYDALEAIGDGERRVIHPSGGLSRRRREAEKTA